MTSKASGCPEGHNSENSCPVSRRFLNRPSRQFVSSARSQAMARFISGSVGQGGVNLKEDVRVIQTMLNQVPAASGGPSPLLDTDGVVGTLTIGAIRRFQQQQVGFSDGRVDVDNVTIRALNRFDSTPAASAPVRFAHEIPQDPNNPRNPGDALDGLDLSATPFPWLLVPSRGDNRVRFVNGGSFSLLTSN